MSKFNTTNTRKTVNRSGHAAYSMKDKEKLVTMVLTTFFNESKFYGDNSGELVELAEKVASRDPHFVANLAVYARKEMHLRSVSHVLASVIAKVNESKPFIKYTVIGVVERPDDVTEILSCYLSMYGKPIPNGLKKALGTVMKRFDAFGFSKYNGGNKQIKFRDVLRICHPRPDTKRQEDTFCAIMNDTLPVTKRWETELSARGNTREVWEELIVENRLGYMAMLRNLRNIISAHPSNIDKVYAKLKDADEVRRSKQLPFRFLSAYRNLPSGFVGKVRDVLEEACEHSIENLPLLPGRTVIAIDISGSMGQRISKNSSVQCGDIAMLLALMANRLCEESVVFGFNRFLKEIRVSSRTSILGASCDGIFSGGTDLELPLRKMIEDNICADRLLIFSDNEINSIRGFKHTCQSLVNEYRTKVNPNLWIHAVDLQGYGTQQFIGDRTNIISGWSERILEFISMAEQGIASQVSKIENYDMWEEDL